MKIQYLGEEGIIYIWDLAKGSCLYKLTGHTGPINSITWSNDLSSNKLYTGSTHGEVKMWTKQLVKIINVLRRKNI